LSTSRRIPVSDRLITKVSASHPRVCRDFVAACRAREPSHDSAHVNLAHFGPHTFLPLTCVVPMVPYLSSLILLRRIGRFPTYLPDRDVSSRSATYPTPGYRWRDAVRLLTVHLFPSLQKVFGVLKSDEPILCLAPIHQLGSLAPGPRRTDLLAETIPHDLALAVTRVLVKCRIQRPFIHIIRNIAHKQPEPLYPTTHHQSLPHAACL